MSTVALELVPPDLEGGEQKAREEAEKIKTLMSETGLEGRINALLIPGMIAEDDDRPVPLRPKMDPLDTWRAVKPHLPEMACYMTQVTAFHDAERLRARFQEMLDAGVENIIMVGVPRTMADGEGDGVAPTDALDQFKDQVKSRGVICIPTREGEQGRFNFKCNQGATFALTQLLHSDAMVGFLKEFAATTSHRPRLLLSFGFIPGAENRLGLIKWLVKDPGNPLVEQELKFIEETANLDLKERRAAIVNIYKQVIDGVKDLGFPISIHLETPYGFNKAAFNTFREMLDYWSPES